MKQNSPEGSEIDRYESADIETILVPPSERPAEILPVRKPPSKKKSTYKTYLKFSRGFKKRLVEYMAEEVNPVWNYKGRKEICSMDCSKLSKDQMLEFATKAFEIYYTDKSVSQVAFEHNSIKFLGGLKG